MLSLHRSQIVAEGQIIVVELVSKGRQSLQPVTAWENIPEAFHEIWGHKKTEPLDTSHTAEKPASGYKGTPGNAASSTAPEGFSPSDSNIPNSLQNVKRINPGNPAERESVDTGTQKNNAPGSGTGSLLIRVKSLLSKAKTAVERSKVISNLYINNPKNTVLMNKMTGTASQGKPRLNELPRIVNEEAPIESTLNGRVAQSAPDVNTEEGRTRQRHKQE